MGKLQLSRAITSLAAHKKWATIPDSGELLEHFPCESQDDIDAALELINAPPAPPEVLPGAPETEQKTLAKLPRGRPANPLVSRVAAAIIDHEESYISILTLCKKIYGDAYDAPHVRAIRKAVRMAGHKEGVLLRRGVWIRNNGLDAVNIHRLPPPPL